VGSGESPHGYWFIKASRRVRKRHDFIPPNNHIPILSIRFPFQMRNSASDFKELTMRLTTLLVAVLLLGTMAAGDEIRVAAAADLTYAFKDVAARFEKETGNKVSLSIGSSGNFYSQIQNGAPYDLFFSADIQYPQKLDGAGLAEKGSLYRYAVGKIVLWVPNSSKLDVKQGLGVLQDPSVRKIAIANPAHAPYGSAAVAALKNEGLLDKVSGKFVLGENISQAAQFVQSGNADAGILALSLVVAPAMKEAGRYFEIPSSEYPTIEQAAIILESSKHKDTARQFVDFLKQPKTVKLMESYGFAVPQK
jgi:molybdate transport system substrate-binding protein